MTGRYTVLTGGVGGAKLVDGLYRLLPANSLTASVNTGDDFRHFSLPISPDIATLHYTLSGISNQSLGWGREGETLSFMAAYKSLGGPDRFNLGDGDLALHVLRGLALTAGEPLSQVIAHFAAAWDLHLSILPMTDDTVATWIDSDEGLLEFQQYFVGRQCAPAVQAMRFVGVDRAMAAPDVLDAIRDSDAVFIAPSNPWLSVDPMLAIPEIRDALTTTAALVVMVSPLVDGKVVKGPTAKLMQELGLDVTNQSIAAHYYGFLDGLIVHEQDAAPDTIAIARTDTMMRTAADRKRVASCALDLAHGLMR